VFSWITGPQAWIALGVLTALEIVLGIDNIIFVFSLDSVITAIGMVEHLPVMVAAVVIAVLVMTVAAGPISDFVEDHPTIKMLALSFLLLIGMSLTAEGLGQHIPRGYIYFAMGFSVFVELLNLRMRSRAAAPVRLRRRIAPHRSAPLPAELRLADGDR
jgi:predicted tellurium resistance membrane protein TerC